jgi:hypothetical protein
MRARVEIRSLREKSLYQLVHDIFSVEAISP